MAETITLKETLELLDSGKPFTSIAFVTDDEKRGSGGEWIENAQPIPLTAEGLQPFSQEFKDWWAYMGSNEIDPNTHRWSFEGIELINKPLYLHRLQNLFFELFNGELHDFVVMMNDK